MYRPRFEKKPGKTQKLPNSNQRAVNGHDFSHRLKARSIIYGMLSSTTEKEMPSSFQFKRGPVINVICHLSPSFICRSNEMLRLKILFL